VPAVIEFRNVRFTHGERAIFDDLNFRIEEREMIALVGPNGVGKTTLLKSLPAFSAQHRVRSFCRGAGWSRGAGASCRAMRRSSPSTSMSHSHFKWKKS